MGRAHARLVAAEDELRTAQGELEGAEAVAVACLRVVVARGELDPTLLYRLYWSTDGLKPGQIAEAVGVRPEQFFKSVGTGAWINAITHDVTATHNGQRRTAPLHDWVFDPTSVFSTYGGGGRAWVERPAPAGPE